MIYIMDATFLTHAAIIDVEILRKIPITSIQSALDEASHNLEDEVAKDKMRHYVEKIPQSKAAKEKDDFKNLSYTDRSLLQTCMDRKNGCILVTDDGLLAKAATQENIKVFSTPGFIENLAKNNRIEKSEAMHWLDALKPFYPRKKIIETTIKRLAGF